MNPEVKVPPPNDLSNAAGVVRDPVSRDLTVGIKAGLHTRPVVLLIKLSKAFLDPDKGESVEFTAGDYSVNPKNNFLGMLMLAAGNGSTLRVTVRGVEQEPANRFLDAVQSMVSHPCPEEAIHQPDAAQTFGLSPTIVDKLQRSIVEALPNQGAA